MPLFSPLEDQIRECFGRVVYTHKTHEKMAEGCAKQLRHLKLLQLCLAGLSSTAALSVIFEGYAGLKILTVLLSIGSFCVSGYAKSFDPGASAQKHRDTASSLWPIRESYLSLLTDIRSETITTEQALEKRAVLQVALASIYKGAPQTNGQAYGAAQDALKLNEEFTFSDQELDVFLPRSLRKGRRNEIDESR